MSSNNEPTTITARFQKRSESETFKTDGVTLRRLIERIGKAFSANASNNAPTTMIGLPITESPGAFSLRAEAKAFEQPVYLLWGVSPDGQWIVGWAPIPGKGTMGMLALPIDCGRPRQIGGSFAVLSWTLDGRSALIGDTCFVPLAVGESLPRIPEGGFHSGDEIAQLPGARRVDEGGLVPGPSADTYAFYRGTIQRNLYRIEIP